MAAERYLRQTTLPAFGPAAQAALTRASVLVVGAGGLGTPVLTYLNAVGVGRLGLVDADRVAVSNLHRQVLYGPADVGRRKVEVAAERLRQQNPDTRLEVHATRLTPANALDLVRAYDLVVDGSDNLPTRYLASDACVIAGRPLVYGAVQGFEGQVAVFNDRDGAPTYRCLFPYDPANAAIPACAVGGVLGVMPGVIGTYQALEVVKVLTGVGAPLSGKLLLLDGRSGEHRTLRIPTVAANRAITTLRADYGDMEDDGAREVDDLPHHTALPATALDALLAQGAYVLDVRTPAERAAAHPDGTHHLPLAELAARADELPRGGAGPIYLLCASGQRSRRAAVALAELRPDLVTIELTGGLAAYAAQPTITTASSGGLA